MNLLQILLYGVFLVLTVLMFWVGESLVGEKSTLNR